MKNALKNIFSGLLFSCWCSYGDGIAAYVKNLNHTLLAVPNMEIINFSGDNIRNTISCDQIIFHLNDIFFSPVHLKYLMEVIEL